MANTPNYNLYKPNRLDAIAVDTSLSDNFTIIDTEIKNRQNSIDAHIASTTAHDSSDLTHESTTVEQAIIDVNDRVDNTDTKITLANNRIDDIIAQSGTSDTEVVDARGGFTVLSDRLNNSDVSVLANKTRSQRLWLDVKEDFGALGDDATDDLTAVRNAFLYANTNGSVKLYFPEGTYLLSNYVQVFANTTVEFHPKAIIKRIGSYYKMFANGEIGNPTYVSGGGYTGDSNIHFIGGTFDLNCQLGTSYPLPTTQTVSFFDIGHAQNISFDGVTVKNGQIGHYFQVSSCKDVRFSNCYLGDVNYSDTSSANYELIQVEVATATTFPSFGIYDLTISQDILIENCTFNNVIRAFGNHSDAQYGTGNTIFCKNIKFINNKVVTSLDNAINLTGFNYSTFKNNVVTTATGYGIQLFKVEDSTIADNVILSIQKSGMNLDTSNNNRFNNNVLKEIGLSISPTYAAIRVDSSNSNVFSANTVTSSTPVYTYAYLSSNTTTTTPNKIVSHSFKTGATSRIAGNNATEHAAIVMGDGYDVLFDGDLSTVAATSALNFDIRNYNFIVVLGNDNSSATAQIVSMMIPKQAIVLTTTSRFRLVCDDSAASDKLDFSFPTSTSVQLDGVSGTCHLRKIIGIL